MPEKKHGYARRILRAAICISLLAGLTAAAFLIEDTGEYYVADGKIVRRSPALDARSVTRATDRFRYLYDTYLKPENMNSYIAVIPDKSYYLPHPKGQMDYSALFELVRSQTNYAGWIDLTETLNGEAYYATDSHWKQECLQQTATALMSSMQRITPEQTAEFEIMTAADGFTGTYSDAAASAGLLEKDAFSQIEPDTIKYLTNRAIEAATVYNFETAQTSGIYDWEKLEGRNPYDFFLSGPACLLQIDNPSATADRKLIVFRDSYGSSLIPLLVPYYDRITVIDIRYVMSAKLGELIDFSEYRNADALFLYSTALLNLSATLR